MTICESDPLGASLKEAEIATRASPPLVVRRKADARLAENSNHPFFVNAILNERKDGLDVLLCADMSAAT